MPYQINWTQIIEFVSGGPDATTGSLMLRAFLIGCLVVAVAQLVTMWSTRWGDRNLLSKSLLLSVLVHLCVGLGWATVSGKAPEAADVITEPEPIAVRLVAETPTGYSGDPAPQQRSMGTTGYSSFEQISHTSRRTTQDRPTTEFSQSAAPIERPRELLRPVPTEVLRDVSPESPRPEQPAMIATAARTVAEVKEASLPFEARTESTTAGRTRVTPARAEPLAQTPTLEPTPANPRVAPQFAPAPAPSPRMTDPRPTPVPVAAARRIDRRPTVQDPNETNGTLRGVVVDAATGRPIAGTTIRFDRAQGKPLTATTREDGSYELALQGTPDTFAVTASQDGYVPDARNMRASDVAAKTGRLDFRLRTSTDNVIVLEKEPGVHHLGNDQFEGRANSRFQRQSEGTTLTIAYDVTAAQLRGPSNSTAVTFSAKGVQCAPLIWVNGHRLTGTNDLTPADGSYGDLVYPFDKSWLHAGKNEIKISATICNGDLDDFEFVNVQVRLSK